VAIFGFEHGGSRRYAELAGRLFGVESADAPLPPGIILEADRPEYSLYKRERLWSDRCVQAAVAAAFSYVQYENPIPSKKGDPGNIVVVQGVILAAAASVLIGVSLVLGGGGAGLANNNLSGISPRDTRDQPKVGTAPNQVMVQRRSYTNTAGGFFDGIVEGVMPATGIITFPFVLAPGSCFRMAVLTNNSSLDGTAFGYERPATADEITQ
jgi:hypothetical protein